MAFRWQIAALVLGVAANLAVVASTPPAAAEEQGAAGTRPFYAGCPENLAGTPWEEDIERKQSKWFFKPKTLTNPQFEVTYSHAPGGNGTRCDPMLGPMVVSQWAGLGRDMITLAPEGPAGSKHLIDLRPIKKGVQYWIVDTKNEAWQRYRAYTPIMLE